MTTNTRGVAPVPNLRQVVVGAVILGAALTDTSWSDRSLSRLLRSLSKDG